MRATAFFLFAFTLAAQDPGRGVNFYSIEKERALGAQIAQEFRKTSTIVENPELLARIEAIARPMIPV